jgi:hypothetical protein
MSPNLPAFPLELSIGLFITGAKYLKKHVSEF